MMAWRYCGMRVMRFTRPFSRPPTARRKITCAMSGRPSSAAGAAPRAGMPVVTAVRCSVRSPVRAAAPRSIMGSILQARGDRRLHRRKEFAQHCAGGVLLVTEIGGDDDRRRIAGLAKQLGFAFPQFGKIVVGGVIAVHPVPIPHQQILITTAQLGLAETDALAADADLARRVGHLSPLRVFLYHQHVLRIDQLGALTLMAVVFEIDADAARALGVTLPQRGVGAEVVRLADGRGTEYVAAALP